MVNKMDVIRKACNFLGKYLGNVVLNVPLEHITLNCSNLEHILTVSQLLQVRSLSVATSGTLI